MTRTTDAERAEFEAWYEADAIPAEADWFTREKDDPSEYKHADTASAWSGWQAARRAPAVPVSQSIEQMAVDRYKVVPSHESMFHRWAVVAGNGTQQLYIGREAECQNMARKFTGAFLDGAFVALAAAPQPVEAAPVQLPRPAARTTSHDGDFYWDNHLVSHGSRFGAALYTEQQVIDLLKSVGVAVKP